MDLLVADWYVDRQRQHADPSLAPSAMVAEHHHERRELNRRARALLAADGTLHGPVLRAQEAEFQAGDEVIARAADRSLRREGGGRRSGVTNGLRGTVVEVRPDSDARGAALVVDFERRGHVTVPYEALTRRLRPGVSGVLAHAYALTSHAAQGDTFQAARHLGTERSSRPGVYVGLSRGVTDCRLYLVRRREFDPPADQHPELPRLTSEATLMEAVTARLRAERRERLAIEVDPDAPAVARLRAAHEVPELVALAARSVPEASLAHRALLDELAAQAASACLHPAPHLVARLGPRPAPGLARQRWDAAVGGVAGLAARWGPVAPDPGAGPAGWALGVAPPEAAPDYTIVAGALRQAEIAFAAGRPATELALEKTELQMVLVLDPTGRRRDDAQSMVSLCRGQLRDRQADQDRSHRRLAELEKAPRRRRNRDGIELARRQAASADQSVAVAENALGRAEDRLRVADVGAIAQEPLRQRLGVVDAALEAKVAEAVERCPAYLDEVLGPRPQDPIEQQSWEEAATCIEGYRHRVLGREPLSGAVVEGTALEAAIGHEPADLTASHAWRSAARSIEPERAPELAHELGIDL